MSFTASSPEVAATKALAVRRNPESIATVFEVQPEAGGDTITVDLHED